MGWLEEEEEPTGCERGRRSGMPPAAALGRSSEGNGEREEGEVGRSGENLSEQTRDAAVIQPNQTARIRVLNRANQPPSTF
jgi:hypothetical protein